MKNPVAFSALLALSFFSHAQSANTITFQGNVSDQTCSVAINGNASNAVVLLPTASMASLDANGKTTGETEFTVSVSGCKVSASPKSINTVFMPSTVTSGGNIKNSGTASNVNLQLLEPNSATGFTLTRSGFEAPGLVLAVNATSASHNFAVRYIAEGGAGGSGSVIGTVQYAVAYP